MAFDEINNRKKALILIPAAIMLLFLVVLAFMFLINKRNEMSNNQPSSQPLNNTELNVQGLKNYDIINKAMKSEDYKACDQLSGDIKASCFYALAVSGRNKEACKKIESQEEQKNCLALFDFQAASRSGDYRDCLNFSQANLKNSCLAEVFRKTDNLKICSNLPKDVSSICADHYYLNSAYENKDKKNCEKINDKIIKMNCEIVSGG